MERLESKVPAEETHRLKRSGQTDTIDSLARREAARLRVVSKVGRKVTSILDLDRLLDETVRLIIKEFGYEYVAIQLRDLQDLDYFYHTACGNPDCTLRGRFRRSINTGIIGRVIREGKYHLANDVALDPDFMPAPWFDTKAELEIPLKINDTVIGALTIEASKINAFDPTDVPVLETLADQIAIAIQNARSSSRAREAAIAEERNRLARELHDDTIQSLIGIERQVDLLRWDLVELYDGLPDLVERRLNRLQDALDNTVKSLRLLSRDLQPQILHDLGLAAALETLLSDLSHNDLKLKTEFSRKGNEIRLRKDIELNIYRIAQEALSNIVKHAKAKTVKVSISYDENEIELSIEDDGKGFRVPEDFSRMALRGGMGLLNMRQRATETGGILSIQSKPNQGAFICLKMPLSR
jgi:signal transduction histidine kinase